MKINGLNNSYRVQPIQCKSNVGCLSDENREKKEQNQKKDKKKYNEFNELLKSKFDIRI